MVAEVVPRAPLERALSNRLQAGVQLAFPLTSRGPCPLGCFGLLPRTPCPPPFLADALAAVKSPPHMLEAAAGPPPPASAAPSGRRDAPKPSPHPPRLEIGPFAFPAMQGEEVHLPADPTPPKGLYPPYLPHGTMFPTGMYGGQVYMPVEEFHPQPAASSRPASSLMPIPPPGTMWSVPHPAVSMAMLHSGGIPWMMGSYPYASRAGFGAAAEGIPRELLPPPMTAAHGHPSAYRANIPSSVPREW